MRKTVDKVCSDYADKGVKVTLKPLKSHSKVVLFEGDELAFEFIGKLFLAHAKNATVSASQVLTNTGHLWS
jgi:hypothetical protein